MDVKLRPFSESFDRGGRHSPLRIVGEIQGDSFVIDVDDTRVRVVTHRIERDDHGAVAWVPADQDFALQFGRLRVLEQRDGSEVLGAEVSVRFGRGDGVSEAGFSVFFNLLGQVDGQGTVRAASEPPVLN